MKKTGVVGSLLSCIIFLFSSCNGNLPLLPDAQNQPQVLINTIPVGKVVNPGMRIPLSVDIPSSLKESAQNPDKLTVELFDSSGKPAATISFDEKELLGTALHPFELPPGLKSGTYSLVFKLYRNGELEQESTVTFFYTPVKLNPKNISSYPVSLYPGASCILEADIEIPEGTDPFLVWKSKNKVLSSGKISAGAGRIEWVAPQEEGVYNVRVDIFPFAPVRSDTFPFSSQDYYEIKIFVTKKPAANPFELPDGKQYLSLFHFRGDFRDEGSRKRAESERISPVGKPALRKEEGIFGYFLDGSSGLSIPAMVFPVGKEKLDPFSLEVRLKAELIREKPDSPPRVKPGVIFSAVAGDFSFVLGYREGGKPYLDLVSGKNRVRSAMEMPALLADAPVSLAVSIVPGETSTQVFWFVNGILNREETLKFPAPPITQPGTSTVGIAGTGPGFVGIIDELGIYTRDEQGRPETDSDFFLRALREEFGRDLLFAEGFDGLNTPEWLDGKSPVSLENGKLSFPAGTTVAVPPVKTASSFIVEIRVSGLPDIDAGYLELLDAANKSEFKASFGSFERREDAVGNGYVLKLTLIRNENGVTVLKDGTVKNGVAIKENAEESEEFGNDLRLLIGNASAESLLSVDGIAVVNYDSETMSASVF